MSADEGAPRSRKSHAAKSKAQSTAIIARSTNADVVSSGNNRITSAGGSAAGDLSVGPKKADAKFTEMDICERVSDVLALQIERGVGHTTFGFPDFATGDNFDEAWWEEFHAKAEKCIWSRVLVNNQGGV